MKLYDGGKAPNPRRVRIYLAEKGLTVPAEPVDMGVFGHKGAEVTALNPLQRLPVLVLDDGTVLTETIAICRYFEELHPEPPLFGTGAKGRALTEMWQRRLELNFFMPIAHAFRHTHPAMKDWEVPQIAEWGEANRPKALEFLALMNRELSEREFAAGDEFSVADITGLVALDFMKPAKITLPDEFVHVVRWRDALRARPSAQA